jgi:hypothetical protein
LAPEDPEEEGLRPVDIVYGCCKPTRRSIEIYVETIREDAPMYGANDGELLQIVRIHEYAHAVVTEGT